MPLHARPAGEMPVQIRPADKMPAPARPAGHPPARAGDASPRPRPTWLLPEPLPLAEHAGRPLHGGPLQLQGAPERIEAGWFDGAPVCRDYHVATGPDHRLRWVFRERRGTQSGWFLHGLFA